MIPSFLRRKAYANLGWTIHHRRRSQSTLTDFEVYHSLQEKGFRDIRSVHQDLGGDQLHPTYCLQTGENRWTSENDTMILSHHLISQVRQVTVDSAAGLAQHNPIQA